MLVLCVLQDWGKLAYDLQRLGFIPEDVGDEVLQEMSGPLGRILVQLSGGGGATKLNIDAGEGPLGRPLCRGARSQDNGMFACEAAAQPAASS